MKSISRISAILIACAALHILEPSSEDAIAASSKNDRPNVLFIMTDDQSRDQFNFLPEGRDEQGKPRNLTPNINRLVANGIAFPNHYASTPVCTPSRFTVLTGMYASRANDYAESAARGEQVNISWNCHIDAETQNIARMLSDAGYFTGAVGKNHVIAGHHKKRISIPFDRSAHEPDVAALLKKKQANQVLSYQECGFDFAASLFAGNLGNRHNTEDTVFHNMDWITQGAMDFFESWQKTEKPFYLYFATTLDHGPGPAKLKYTGDPLATPAGFLEKPLTVQPSRASIPERVTAAGLSLDTTACDVLWMDDAIGALLDRLETMGALDNTVIFFFDDHGVEDGKGSLYDGGIRSVSFVSGPDRYLKDKGRISDIPLSNTDFLPTILELAGVDEPAGAQIDGASYLSILQGIAAPIHESLYFEIGATRAVLQDEWKYLSFRLPEEIRNASQEMLSKMNPSNPHDPFTHIADKPGGRGSEQPAIRFYPNYFDTDQLYRISKDPTERENLYSNPEYGKKAKELKALLNQELDSVPGIFGEFSN